MHLILYMHWKRIVDWKGCSKQTYFVFYFIIWLTDFACCDWSITGPQVAVRTSSSRSPFQSRNNQQIHIINILLASFAWFVRNVMDPRFFLPCFHGPRASRLGHKRKKKTRSITSRLDWANEANKMFIIVSLIVYWPVRIFKKVCVCKISKLICQEMAKQNIQRKPSFSHLYRFPHTFSAVTWSQVLRNVQPNTADGREEMQEDWNHLKEK